MSINWVMLTQDGKAPVPLPQEKIFFTQKDVKLILDCNETEAGYPGHSEGYFESNKGTVILSNQRIMYLVEHPNSEFKNLNVPIMNFKNWKLEQPWFGANYIAGVVLPVQNGGLTKNSQLKLTFSEGGAIEFTTILRSLLERMGESNDIPAEYEPLPTYQPDQSSSSPPDHDLPPQYSA
ncbi:uncharacterized protein B0P05DRAFT_534163 [Gilbertella persicaria]|uniref:GRAM domain-containing protein n=1 Tax=Rhizopus stolonifer TaxID=4846 RepID=A0A367JPC7_RHIST|nr:uncharacterized protein B0P05DRAFT_534163 [Gilbertella persicaria]KAI8085899.1 hypothetical protein B0P05DRAFT_534163 [Gilbertella persicaria]RCH91793.1 hypothetical protein CU098_007437 [Rhizopus stolonifer]